MFIYSFINFSMQNPMNCQSPDFSSLAPFNCSLCNRKYLNSHLFTSSIISQELNNSNIHQLLNLHLSIIQELQEKLIQKELELDAKTDEYSQLESKLLRLQRRLQFQFKESKMHSTSNNSFNSISTKTNSPSNCVSKKQKKKINAKLTLELRTHIHYLNHSIANNEDVRYTSTHNQLELPSFRVAQNNFSNSTIFPGFEDLSDRTFLRRHKKLEESEKRSKRWDSRRYRERKKFNELQNRHDKVNNKYSSSDLYSPSIYTEDANEIKQIEVSDTVAIQGFGAPLPAILPTHFELNWIGTIKD